MSKGDSQGLSDEEVNPSRIVDAPHATRTVRVGVVGGGRVVERFYLPVLAELPQCQVTCVVDVNAERARSMAGRHAIPQSFQKHTDVVGKVDAAVVAVPHHLHFEIARDLLEAGVNVLVEKPMALRDAECEAMIRSAEKTGAVLAVGLVERFYENSELIRKCVETGVLGRISRYECERGRRFDWDVVSDFQFRKECGGGVLLDIGVHMIDQLLWWFGDLRSAEYQDNAEGGVETDCLFSLSHEGGVEGVVELSRSRDLRNRIVLFSDRGCIEVELGHEGNIRFTADSQEVGFDMLPVGKDRSPRKMAFYFSALLRDFLSAINGDRLPRVSGVEGRRAVRAIEQLKSNRRRMACSWGGSYA